MREIIASLYSFFDKYMYWMQMPDIGVIDIIEIILITIALYYFLVWVRNTRAWSLFKGILVVLIFVLIAAIFQMNTILWLFGKLLNFGVIALLIIFQPELRRGLERIGRSNFLTRFMRIELRPTDQLFSNRTINELVRACVEMGKKKTGALIVIERSVMLEEYIRSGIRLDAELSRQLLLNIFEKNTPLHDGAIILRGNRIIAATCYLPLTDNMALSKELGTRHRAAVGISEVSDSVTIIVSEETGEISVARENHLERSISEERLREILRNIAGVTEKQRRSSLRDRKNRKEDNE